MQPDLSRFEKNRTLIDRLKLSFSTPSDSGLYHELVQTLISPLYMCGVGHKGRHGYEKTYEFRLDGRLLAVIYTGGFTQRDRDFMDITGFGCEVARQYNKFNSALTLNCINYWHNYYAMKVKEMHLAVDLFNPGFTLDHVYDWYNAGWFDVKQSRHSRPKESWRGPRHLHPEYGRTLYIGSSSSKRFTRIYEKGKELFNTGKVSQLLNPDWIRVESIFKADRRATDHPWNYFMYRDSIFVDMNKFNAWLISNVNPWKETLTPKNQDDLITKTKHNLKSQWGKIIRTMIDAEGEQVILELASDSGSPLLEQAYKIHKPQNLEAPF